MPRIAEKAFVDRFVDECVVADSLGEISATEFFAAYRRWCGRDIRAATMTAFGRALRELGFTRRKSSKIIWVGGRLKQGAVS